jgi:hypothetical protein
MKFFAAFIAICLVAILGATSYMRLTDRHGGPNTRHILFIGNSFTSYHDMPAIVEKMAREAGEDVRVTMLATGGYTLQNHFEDQNALAVIDSRVWDDVVLQEQSQRFAFRQDWVTQNSFPYGEALANHIRKRSPKVRLYWYETWGYRNGDVENCAAMPHLPWLCNYQGMQAQIHVNMTEMARRTRADLVEVGTKWQQHLQQHPQIELYDADGMHPSPTGSQLAAHAFYSELFPKRQ